MTVELHELEPNEIVSRYQKWAHSVAYAKGGYDNQEHDDLAQEALIGVWKSLDKHDTSKGALASFAATAGKMHMNDAIRRNRYTGAPSIKGSGRRPEALIPSDMSDYDESVDDFSPTSDNKMAVRRVMASMPQDQQIYLFLRFWQDMSLTEIQQHINGGVNHTWKLIREHMRRELDSEGIT